MEDFFEGWLAFPGFAEILDWMPPKKCELPFQKYRDSFQIAANTNTGKPLAEARSTDQRVGTNTSAASHSSRQRRGHTKSRLGCIPCKKRKIKETWPSCTNCTKRGTECRYPTATQRVHCRRMAAGSASPRQIVQLSVTTHPFGVEDLRLFHHYMVAAYPCIPHGCDSVWTRDVPRYSHHYPYLMEAMLAMAGTHLTLLLEDESNHAPLLHRQKAIHGLEDAFTRWPPSAEEAHVMLATSYMLCFQSGYIEDGLQEHFLSLRGCAFLSRLILGDNLDGPFKIHVNMHTQMMENKLYNFPKLDQELAREALRSIQAFSHLIAPLDSTSIEKALVTQYVEMLQPLLEIEFGLCLGSVETTPSDTTTATTESSISSPSSCPGHLFIQNPLFEANLVATFDSIDWTTITSPKLPKPDPLRSFNAIMASIIILTSCAHTDLVRLLDRSNQLSNVIMAHFIAVKLITSPLSAPPTAMRTLVAAFVGWAEKILDAVKDDVEDGVRWTEYVVWPRKILRFMQECLKMKKDLCFGDIYEILIEDPGAIREGRGSLILAVKRPNRRSYLLEEHSDLDLDVQYFG